LQHRDRHVADRHAAERVLERPGVRVAVQDEVIDCEGVRDRMNGSPYAKAFFTLIEELGLTRALATSD
jgi:hypothetical protein